MSQQITFDKEKLQSPPDPVPTPYITRLEQFRYAPCPGSTYDLSITEAVPLETKFEPPLRFNERTWDEVAEEVLRDRAELWKRLADL